MMVPVRLFRCLTFLLHHNKTPGGASWADLDNDGDIDCIVAQKPSGVYLNDGIGNFTDVSSQIDSLNSFPAWGCAIGNWNNDAHLDFVFAHAGTFHTPGPFPAKLYLNTANSITPQYITGYEITDNIGPYTVPYWSDFDLDGDMDLFMASGPGGSAGPDYCYRNLKIESGNDTLELMTTELFAAQLQDGQCYNFIDADNDEDLDLCLTNYAGAQTKFYINNSGTYSLQTMPFTATAQNLTNCWGDYDNDGDVDVIITNDAVASKLYVNNGSLNFSNAISFGMAGACGITNGDYDNDGDVDLFVHGLGNSRALYRNDSVYNNNWVNIKCNGISSNKSAVGAIVKLKATINGNTYWQTREVSAQNSFQSQNDLRVHFGLGNATIIDSVIVSYSGGQTSTLTNIAVNNFYCHDEGSNSLCLITSINQQNLTGHNDIAVSPNPTDSFLQIKSQNKIEQWMVFDESGRVCLTGASHKVNLSAIKKGSYFISIFSKHKKATFSIQKN
ncbi:MAG: VCBS repeat-containing protein [Bacteroidetes bacterium]|nr:VCBS repeat-containing protein [Bacteroidota bacterium]